MTKDAFLNSYQKCHKYNYHIQVKGGNGNRDKRKKKRKKGTVIGVAWMVVEWKERAPICIFLYSFRITTDVIFVITFLCFTTLTFRYTKFILNFTGLRCHRTHVQEDFSNKDNQMEIEHHLILYDIRRRR